MQNDVDVFIQNFVLITPELNELLKEHLQEYGELLPHVLFGEVTRFIERYAEMLISKNPEANNLVFQKIINFLEDGLVIGTKEIRELISVSFLENLDISSKSFNFIERHFGNTMKREMKFYKN